MALIAITHQQARTTFINGGLVHIKTASDSVGITWNKESAPCWSTLEHDYYKGEAIECYGVSLTTSHNTVTGKKRGTHL